MIRNSISLVRWPVLAVILLFFGWPCNGISQTHPSASSTQPSKADQIIEKELQRSIPQINFNQTPMADAIDFVHDITGITIVTCDVAITNSGTDSKKVAVTAVFQDTPLSQVLDAIVAAAGPAISYRVEHGVIVISSQDAFKREDARSASLGSRTNPHPTLADQKQMKLMQSAIPSINFNQTPSKDAFDFLHDITKANVDVNWHELAKFKIAPDSPLTLEVRKLPLSDVLFLMLDQLSPGNLSYEVRDGKIRITSVDKLRSMAATQPSAK